MDAVEFLKQRLRLCKSNFYHGCNPDCPLYKLRIDKKKKTPCLAACDKYPEKAVDIVESWSNRDSVNPNHINSLREYASGSLSCKELPDVYTINTRCSDQVFDCCCTKEGKTK